MDGLPQLTKAARLIRLLLKEPCFGPQRRLRDKELGSILRQVPQLLEDYRSGIEAFLKQSIPDKYSFYGPRSILQLGEHVYYWTGRYHWPVIAELVTAYGGELDAD